MSEKRYIVFRDKIIEIIKNPAGLWLDREGTIYGLPEDKSADNKTRCGVGFFSLPEDHALTDACRPHDYAYNSMAYQTFHSREEADKYLRDLIKQVGRGKWYGVLAQPFYLVCRLFGRRFWGK